MLPAISTAKLMTSRKVKSSKWKDQIRKMYAGLETIAREEADQKRLDNVTNDFQNFFVNGTDQLMLKHKRFRLLFDKEILSGTVSDTHRNSSLLRKQEDSPINGDTLLLRAMSINVEKGSKQEKVLNWIIKDILIEKCPEMIVFPKENDSYMGITPLHLAILKGDAVLLRKMEDSLKKVDDKKERISEESQRGICAVGPVFQDTVMMAGTPLGVAALNFDKTIFDIVLKTFATGIDVINDKGDNIIHSLIKYAYVQPDKRSQVLEMIRHILGRKFNYTGKTNDESNQRRKVRKLLMMTNIEKLNPLQLSVKRQQFRIFELIMQSEVYCTMESGDGLFNEEAYDITEIETLNPKDAENAESIKPEHHESILEYLVHQQTNEAFLFADFLPVKEVIRGKWQSYRWFFMGWFLIHLIFMVFLSVAAVYRSKFSVTISKTQPAEYAYTVSHNTFVTTVSVVGLVFGLFYISMEASRKFISRFQFKTSSRYAKHVVRHLSTPYSNLIFRLYFVLFSFLLIVDCIIAATEASGSFSGYENYCLIFAVIIGWYLVMFFLQTFLAFSMFTVLIQRAMIDMLKFALVMTFFLVAFSVAMFMIMQGADTEEEDFNFFSTTIIKMLMIMLGLGDLNILFQARQPYLAICVFVLFVLLTTVLLLNALIAMMSNSCTDLMNNYGGVVANKLHGRLQKLSVILFLEGFLPRCLCKEVGEMKRKLRYHNNEWVYGKQRRIWVRSSVHDHHKKHDTEKSTNTLHVNNTPEGVVSLLMQQLNPEIKDRYSMHNRVEPSSLNTTYIDPGNVTPTNSVEIMDNDKEEDVCPLCESKRPAELEADLQSSSK